MKIDNGNAVRSVQRRNRTGVGNWKCGVEGSTHTQIPNSHYQPSFSK